jgi:hypothetical protein
MALAFAPQREATFKDGCMSVRKATLDNMRAAQAPGPIYTPLPRISSTERSLCDIKFGTGPARYNDIGTFKKPGPQAYDPESIRKAVFACSTKRNVTGVKFCTGPRTYNDIGKFKCPGPAEYDPEMIRRGILFSKSGSTSIKFGTGPARYNDMKSFKKPGPQAYDPELIKRGIMFTKSGLPSVKFGNPPKKPGVAATGHQNPGPLHYDTDKVVSGVFRLSTKRNPIGVKFATGPRTYNDAEEKERKAKPGPGQYKLNSAMGTQVSSRYKSQPIITFGAR